MGGGPLYKFNKLSNNNNNIPMMPQLPVVPAKASPQLSSSQQKNQQEPTIPAQSSSSTSTLYEELVEQSKKREQYNRRSNYNPFLNQQSSWSSTSHSNNTSFDSVYPSYDPDEFQLDPVPLTTAQAATAATVQQKQQQKTAAPELPPVPAAYRNSKKLNTSPRTPSPPLPPRTPSPLPVINESPIIVAEPVPVAIDTTATAAPTAQQQVQSPIPTSTTTNNNNNQVRLIYTKSGFYLKDQDTNSSIHGFLAIFSKSMENVDILIAWIPEYLIEPHDIALFIQLDGILASDRGFPSVQLNLGQAETMTIILKHVYSLYICPPSLATQGSIVITSRTGDVFKPIWYASAGSGQVPDLEEDKRTWPGYDVIDILSAFIPLQSSAFTQNVHLVETPLEPTTTTTTQQNQQQRSKAAQEQEHTDDPIVKALRDVRWTLLERLSRITQYTQDTAASVLSSSRPILPFLNGTKPSAAAAQSTTANEYQMASQYLARYGSSSVSQDYHLVDDTDGLLHGMPELCGPTPIHTRRPPISPEEWINCFDHEGKLSIPVADMNQLIFQGGLDSDIRIEAWKFLLGIYPWHSTFDEREAIRRSRAEAYYTIKSKWFDNTEIRNTKHFQDEKHRIDKDVHRTDRNQEAFLGDELPNPDPLMAVGTNHNLEIMKDILVTYNFRNTDLGYVQGMSDLLAPLFVAMGDEPMAFWGFSLFMDRVESNFFMDQSGMHGQLKMLDALIQFMDPVLYKRLEETETNNLFFCFRWLLVWFKREFEWEDVIRLWEVLWTNHLSDKFILFVALAVIDAHRKTILEDLTQFDEVLRYVNDLTGHIPLEPTLERAEVLFYQFERKIRAMQHKKTMLQDQLQIRSVWNSPERPKIQERIEKLKIPEILLTLLPPLSSSFD